MTNSSAPRFATLPRVIVLLTLLAVVGCASPEQKAQNYYERGMQYLAKDDYVKASIEFKNALQLKKDHVDAWRAMVRVEEHNQNWPAVGAILNTVVELDSKDVKSRISLGRLMLIGNELEKALSLVNAAQELDDRNAGVHALKAAVLLRSKDLIGAKSEAEEALVIDPANAEALIVLGAERLVRGDTEGALLALQREAATNEKDIGVQVFKLMLFNQLQQLDKVEDILRRLVQLYPKDGSFRRLLVAFYIERNRPADAEKELRSMVAASDGSVEMAMDLVRFVQQNKGPDAARQELLALASAAKQPFLYQIAAAEFDFSLGKRSEAIRQLEQLVSSNQAKDQTYAAQNKLAELQVYNGDIAAAETILSNILSKDARNLSALKLRARIRIERGQLEQAIADIRQALNDQPRSPDLMFLLASAYERSGSLELAEKQYADATRASNFDPGITLQYVTFLRRRANLDRAEEVLSELAARWPQDVTVLTTLAEVRLDRKNWIGAQAIAEKIRDDNKNPALAGQIMGMAFEGRGRQNDSIAALESAYAASPSVSPSLRLLVAALIKAQKFDRATALLDNVLRSEPDSAEAHVLLGSVFLAKNAPDRALKSFQAAIDRQPKQITGYLAVAEYYMKSKNYSDAEKVIRTGLGYSPDNFTARFALAGILELKGDYDNAISEYEGLLQQQPGSLAIANNLASLLSDHRSDKSSLDRAFALGSMLRKSPLPSFKDTLGWVYFQRGDHKGALPLLEEAAAGLPDQAVVQYHLGMCYLALGQSSKATEQFKKALGLSPEPKLQERVETALKRAAL